MQEYIEGITRFIHSHWFPWFLAAIFLLFGKFVLSSPQLAARKMLGLFYTPKLLDEEMEVSCASSGTHIILPPGLGGQGYLPAIKNIEISFRNKLRFIPIEIRRAQVDLWVFNRALVCRERFLGQKVKSSSSGTFVFDIDLDEFRVARVKENLSGNTTLKIKIKIDLQCSTFFSTFGVKKECDVIAEIWN